MAAWPESLEELVRLRSAGRVCMAADGVVGRYLVAAEELPAREPAMTEEALFWGSDEARFLRSVCKRRDVEDMIEAWERPEGGGSDPLSHFDLFCGYALAKVEAGKAGAGERLRRLESWFCRPEESWVDRKAQREKLEMIRGAFKAGVKVSMEELRVLDDVLNRNAEEFTGAVAVFQGQFLARRRFQGIFPCKDLIQHSCAPNCMTVAGPDWGENGEERLVMHVVPLRSIAKGERLTWCYLPYWKWLWPTQLRRAALKEAWDFVCACPRCEGSAETVMAFKCPSCTSEALSPAAPCTVRLEQGACATECGCDTGQANALAAVEDLQCACGLRLSRGGAAFPGYLERCLEEEARVLALPWKGVLGRDLQGLGASLLQSRHWLRVDTASQILENGPGIFKELGLQRPRSSLSEVQAWLEKLAAAAELLLEACAALHGDDLCPALPGLLLSKALCTGAEADFEACHEAQLRVYGALAGARSTGASLLRLRRGPCHFLEGALQLSPAAVDRLARCQPAAAEQQEELRGERAKLLLWLPGLGALQEREGAQGLGAWVLRRMWLCPDLSERDVRKAQRARKRPAAKAPAPAAPRKRPAAQGKAGPAGKRPARGK